MNRESILIVDDESSMRHMLTMLLKKEGYDVDAVEDGEKALNAIGKGIYDFVLCDIKMPGIDGMEFLKRLKSGSSAHGALPTVIMMSAYGTMDTALECMKLGAYDYISKPFRRDEIILTLRKAEERERLRRENVRLKEVVTKEYRFENIVASSPRMLEIFNLIKKVADYNSTVLIIGESGTGKELIAKALHFNSIRRDAPFVPVNCGAIPGNLLESELFGHIKGAFTDATKDKKGLFEEAHTGTIFLDEIGEFPRELQVKLLRVLQEGEMRRLGDTKSIKVDVRVIAATAKDLGKEVQDGEFREDLFYRLNVIPIHLPPLRERKEDIPLLIDHFLKIFNEKMGKEIKGVDPKAMKHLLDYDWPGNVRELENTIERAVILEEGELLSVENLPLVGAQAASRSFTFLDSDRFSLKDAQSEMEKELIKRALSKAAGNKSKAAKLLEISYRALLYKLKDYGLE